MRKTECFNNFSNYFPAFELTRPQGSRETVLPALDFFLAGLLDSIGMFILSEERWFDSFWSSQRGFLMINLAMRHSPTVYNISLLVLLMALALLPQSAFYMICILYHDLCAIVAKGPINAFIIFRSCDWGFFNRLLAYNKNSFSAVLRVPWILRRAG